LNIKMMQTKHSSIKDRPCCTQSKWGKKKGDKTSNGGSYCTGAVHCSY
jgi:hypothetical protein